jgi:dTDP-glucose 4,6-dehydratase
MKIALLGGGNCYSHSLANLAHKEGFDVFGIGRNPPKVPAMWQVYKEYRYYQAHLIFHQEAAMAILDTERPDYIVNFAAQGEGQGSFENPVPFYETNTVALIRLAEKLKTRKYLKRFIQVGTSELYGSVTSPSKETDPIQPTSPYAVSKASFDLHLDILRRFGFPCSVIRPSNAYCPGQQLHRIIPKTIITALSGKRLPLQGGGKSKKTYLHASDLSRAILLLLTSEPGIYNCGRPLPISIRELVELTLNACGVKFEDCVDITEDRVGQDGCYWLDSSKLIDLGWEPKIKTSDGLEQMVQWVEKYPELLKMSTDWKVTP